MNSDTKMFWCLCLSLGSTPMGEVACVKVFAAAQLYIKVLKMTRIAQSCSLLRDYKSDNSTD